MRLTSILLLIAFAAWVGVSIVSPRAGAVALGLLQFAAGCVVAYRQEIGFGVRGFAPSGHIKGFPAILFGVAMMSIGLLLIWRPEALGW